MAGVFKPRYGISDARIKFLTLKRFKKTWVSPFPLEIFLNVNKNNLCFLTSTTINNVNTLSVKVSAHSQITQHNLLLSSLSSLFTYYDASCYKDTDTFTYMSTFSCLYVNTRINFFINNLLTDTPSIVSSSNIFLSSQWVERELREFFNLLVINLNDTRRLLTDYTIYKVDYTDYKTLSYDLISQDLYNY